MRFHSTRARVYAWVLGLSALMAASTRSQAQDVVSPEVPTDQGRHHHLHHGWGFFHARPPAIPRTYSYYYDRWSNQPRHSRVVGPDGMIPAPAHDSCDPPIEGHSLRGYERIGLMIVDSKFQNHNSLTFQT
jgi:hypothetical protein